MRKICVVTATRAEYGLLKELMKGIQNEGSFTLQVIATGTHLSPEFGMTYQAIEQDGFKIDEKLEMLLSSDSPIGVTKSMGLATISFAEAFARLKPDLVVLMGDRYELMPAAQSAMIARIPIAHLAGGDDTPSAFDNTVRHCVTKMAHIHFVTTEDAAIRIRQMGENPDHVHVVGNTGIDQIKRLKLLSRSAFETAIQFKLLERNLLITFHPVSLDFQPVEEQFAQLLEALDQLGPEVGLIFTKPNSDTYSRIIVQMIDQFVATHANARGFNSLGQLIYLSAVTHVDAVVGNSSSGLCEVPSLKKPTVNIGERQKGRVQGNSVIQSGSSASEILKAIRKSFTMDCSSAVNPYGDGESSARVLKALKNTKDYRSLLQKTFFLQKG